MLTHRDNRDIHQLWGFQGPEPPVRSYVPSRAVRICVVQTVVTDYRVAVFEELGRRSNLTVLAGVEAFEEALEIVAVDEPHERASFRNVRAIRVENKFLFGRRLLWQRGVVQRTRAPEAVFLELNPRVLSSWVVLIGRRLMRRPVILWGHAWPREGSGATSDRLRARMRSLADIVLVYTEQQARELREREPSLSVMAAPNALEVPGYRPIPAERRRRILYVGRLTSKKKPRLLLEAFELALERGLPDDYELTIAGDGPLRGELERFAGERSTLQERVRFVGHIQPEDITPVLEETLVTVAPGYIGLAAVQSLAMGIPVVVGDREPHAPEIEAVEPGWNGLIFESDSAVDLARALLSFVRDLEQWNRRRDRIAQACRERYSVGAMADRFLEAARSLVR